MFDLTCWLQLDPSILQSMEKYLGEGLTQSQKKKVVPTEMYVPLYPLLFGIPSKKPEFDPRPPPCLRCLDHVHARERQNRTSSGTVSFFVFNCTLLIMSRTSGDLKVDTESSRSDDG